MTIQGGSTSGTHPLSMADPRGLEIDINFNRCWIPNLLPNGSLHGPDSDLTSRLQSMHVFETISVYAAGRISVFYRISCFAHAPYIQSFGNDAKQKLSTPQKAKDS